MNYRALVQDTDGQEERTVARQLRDHGYEVILTDSEPGTLHIDVVQEDVDLVYAPEAGEDVQEAVQEYGADPAWIRDPSELRLDWEQYDGVGAELATVLDGIPPFDPDRGAVEDRIREEYGKTGKALLARTEV